jgi:hypothetical protein
MHGQKKRRKRTRDGLMKIEGFKLYWYLVSEPQITTHGPKGLCISVRTTDNKHRELILEYRFPNKRTRVGLLQVPQRPKFTERTVEADVRRAIASGWEPDSRGKAVVLKLSEAAD